MGGNFVFKSLVVTALVIQPVLNSGAFWAALLFALLV